EYGWCGNSYGVFDVPAGTYRSLLGWLPEKGELRAARYQLLKSPDFISNEALLPVGLADMERARFDHVAIETRNLDVLRAILLEPRPPIEGDELSRIRKSAIQVLKTMPREQALPVLEAYWAGGNPTECEVIELIEGFHEFDPEGMEERILEALADRRQERRYQVLRTTYFLPNNSYAKSGQLRERMVAIAMSPQIDVPAEFFESLLNLEDGEETLRAVIGDESVAPSKRFAARFVLEKYRRRTYGRPIVNIRFPEGSGVRGMLPQDKFIVTVTNGSEDPLEIRYSDPREIVSLYFRIQTRDRDLLLSAIEPEATRGDAPPSTRLVLRVKEVHEIELRLSDLVDFSSFENEPQLSGTVYARVLLPGAAEPLISAEERCVVELPDVVRDLKTED
ncbi:MAG: hypothetical protein L0Z55_06610, partial [Planctomycetes bacterium]|nr:hypothetical protein [Planctomycetota bacterium]